MSAMTTPRRPRSVSVSQYVDIDVEVDAEDLEAQGWVYVGEGGVAPVPTLERLIREMHDDEHEGPIRWCRNPVCHEVENPS